MNGTHGRVHDVRNAPRCLRCDAVLGCAACFERGMHVAAIALMTRPALNGRVRPEAEERALASGRAGLGLRCLAEQGVPLVFAERGAHRCDDAA